MYRVSHVKLHTDVILSFCQESLLILSMNKHRKKLQKVILYHCLVSHLNVWCYCKFQDFLLLVVGSVIGNYEKIRRNKIQYAYKICVLVKNIALKVRPKFEFTCPSFLWKLGQHFKSLLMFQYL